MAKKNKKKIKTKQKKSYKKTMSDKKYNKFIKQNKKGKLSLKNYKKLSKELNRKYCKCIQAVRSTLKKSNKGAEYPICTSSIYTKRGIKPPKDKNKKC